MNEPVSESDDTAELINLRAKLFLRHAAVQYPEFITIQDRLGSSIVFEY